MKESFVKRRKKELIAAVITLVIILGVSFAWLTQTLNGTTENVIVSGNLKLVLNNESPILRLGGDYGYGEPMSNEMGLTGAPYTFTITNTGTEEAYYNLYLDDVSSYKNRNNQTVNITDGTNGTRISDTKIDYNLRVGTDTNSTVATLSSLGNPRELVTGATLAAGVSVTYSLRLWIDSSAVNSDVVGKVFAGKLRIEATQASRYENVSNINSHIKAVYEYNQNGSGTGSSYTGCLGGAEAGCVDVKNSYTSSSTYAVGTVIKYEVKDGLERYFNVIHDDGSTLTLQQRENTVASTDWTTGEVAYSNTNTPNLTSGFAFYELEQATADWEYVNTQNYSIGDNTTTLGYSACKYEDVNCDKVGYTLTRTAQARMITVQELASLNCAFSGNSCKVFVYNYLNQESHNNSTVSFSTDTKREYYTMNTESIHVIHVSAYGGVTWDNANVGSGVRAVIVIDK